MGSDSINSLKYLLESVDILRILCLALLRLLLKQAVPHVKTLLSEGTMHPDLTAVHNYYTTLGIPPDSSMFQYFNVYPPPPMSLPLSDNPTLGEAGYCVKLYFVKQLVREEGSTILSAVHRTAPWILPVTDLVQPDHDRFTILGPKYIALRYVLNIFSFLSIF